MDVQSAQSFVNSSLVPVLLCRWRLKSVADVLKGIRNTWVYSVQVGGFAEVIGMQFVVMVLEAPFVPFNLGMSGSPLTCMDFISGSLIPLMDQSVSG